MKRSHGLSFSFPTLAPLPFSKREDMEFHSYKPLITWDYRESCLESRMSFMTFLTSVLSFFFCLSSIF